MCGEVLEPLYLLVGLDFIYLLDFGCCGLPLNVTGWISLILHSGQLWWGIIQTSAEQDWRRGVQWWPLWLTLQKCDLPPNDFRSLQVRAFMTAGGRSASRLSGWSRNQFQLLSWCCNQIHGDCWILITFTDKWLGTKNQGEQIKGHWKIPLLMTTFPSSSRDNIMVLSFPCLLPPPLPVSALNHWQDREGKTEKIK